MHSAIRASERFESRLRSRWSLHFKQTEKHVLVPAGAPEDDPPAPWVRMRSMKVLGHYVSHDGSWMADQAAAQRAMWAAFFANVSSKPARLLSVQKRLRLMNTSVRSAAEWRFPLWPWTRSTMLWLDRLQRRMLSMIQGTPRWEAEPWDSFHRRRARAAAQLQRQIGPWSARHARRLRAWEAHLRRSAAGASWAQIFLEWRGTAWIRAQRAIFGTFAGGGRTGTRVLSQPPSRPWHEP